jgi:hypothetical protein
VDSHQYDEDFVRLVMELAVENGGKQPPTNAHRNRPTRSIPIWENEKGRSLMERLDVLEEEMKEVKKMKKSVRIMETSSFQIRSRFFETYIRDVLERKPNMSTIIQGNMAAHSGDSVLDSHLFESKYRDDPELLKEIYGLDLTEIIKLREY